MIAVAALFCGSLELEVLESLALLRRSELRFCTVLYVDVNLCLFVCVSEFDLKIFQLEMSHGLFAVFNFSVRLKQLRLRRKQRSQKVKANAMVFSASLMI